MNQQESDAVASLREKGYSVTIFNPEELRGADPERVGDRLVELGWDVIECLATEPMPKEN